MVKIIEPTNRPMKAKFQLSLKLLLPLLASILAISPLAVDMYLPAMPTLAEHLNTPILWCKIV
jgi:DHA1 family bicyclomycin/chloramphenicol resistance-like MFS transporter